jgi:hypothetical protein
VMSKRDYQSEKTHSPMVEFDEFIKARLIQIKYGISKHSHIYWKQSAISERQMLSADGILMLDGQRLHESPNRIRKIGIFGSDPRHLPRLTNQLFNGDFMVFLLPDWQHLFFLVSHW